MSGNPFAVLADHTLERDGWRLPSFVADTERLMLEPGEQALQEIQPCSIELNTRVGNDAWSTIWETEKPGTVTITDRRVVLACRAFDRGSSYGGFGGGAALIGLGLTAISRARAKSRTAGQCFGGHLRYEWLSAVGYQQAGTGLGRSLAGLVDVPIGILTVVSWDRGRNWRLHIGGVKGHVTPAETAELVAHTAIGVRLDREDELNEEQITSLRHARDSLDLKAGPGETKAVRITGAWAMSYRPAAPTP
jgi:hypothetical protein